MADNVLIKDPKAKFGYRATRVDGRKRQENLKPFDDAAELAFGPNSNSKSADLLADKILAKENTSHEPYSLRKVKGASPEFIARTNKDYEDVVPFLKESGYNLEGANSALFEKYMDDLFAKIDADQELQGLYNSGKYEEGNNLYNERYGKLFNALDKGWDKFSTDEWVAKAPMGYED